MTREEAKEILTLHRDGQSDPAVTEAMRFVATDPEMERWWAERRAFQDTVREQFRAIEPPPGLKEKILSQRPTRKPSIFADTPLLAIAASIVLLLALVVFWRSGSTEQETFANFRARMTGFAVRTYAMDIVTNSPVAVRQLLSNRGAPADFPLTSGLEKLQVKGGGRLSWHNHPVAMMCFSLPDQQTGFMFVIDEQLVKAAPNEIVTGPYKGLNTVSWREAGKVYLLAAAEAPDDLRKLAP
jgi:hypothetical protein